MNERMNESMGELIKKAREQRGLTQEQLAERLELSRQAISKWEMGASVPSPENLPLLEQVLGVTLPRAGEAAAAEPRKGNPWKPAALILALLLATLCALTAALVRQIRPKPAVDAGPPAPTISGVYFFDQQGRPLEPDLGDGWNRLEPDEPVTLIVRFQDYGGGVNAVTLYFTPTGTETLDQRQQMAVQPAGEGRDFALFTLSPPPDTMGHLDIVLECSGGISVTETLKVIAALP